MVLFVIILTDTATSIDKISTSCHTGHEGFGLEDNNQITAKVL